MSSLPYLYNIGMSEHLSVHLTIRPPSVPFIIGRKCLLPRQPPTWPDMGSCLTPKCKTKIKYRCGVSFLKLERSKLEFQGTQILALYAVSGPKRQHICRLWYWDAIICTRMYEADENSSPLLALFCAPRAVFLKHAKLYLSRITECISYCLNSTSWKCKSIEMLKHDDQITQFVGSSS